MSKRSSKSENGQLARDTELAEASRAFLLSAVGRTLADLDPEVQADKASEAAFRRHFPEAMRDSNVVQSPMTNVQGTPEAVAGAQHQFALGLVVDQIGHRPATIGEFHMVEDVLAQVQGVDEFARGVKPAERH